VDRDGDLDLAVGNEHTPSTNYLYVNNDNSPDFLALKLEGRFHDLGAGYSNRDGVGAKVFVYETGFLGDPAHLLGFREIEAHGGFSSQSSIEAHFGLPGRTAVDVRIVWPGSGGANVVQDLAGLPVGHRFEVDEAVPGTAAPEVERATPAGAWLVAPNPTDRATRIELAGGRAGATIEIVDALGRRVRELHLAGSGDAASVTWDGRGENGRAVAAGVYFVRLVGRDPAPPARIAVVR
jgi:hypothetical protein